MLMFDKRQMAAMVEARRNSFVEHLGRRLAPDGTATDAIREAVARSNDYGLSLKSTIARFVALRLVYGSDFDSSPKVRRLLLDATSSEQRRVANAERFLGATRGNAK